ncbi:aromatic ring-hydroxylating dioxygenase subunit alpha, partial [Alphaproteobacteria bacterium]|nr:aromatic ring-hydroxylating dioxygenase subunit alpha [Alphaproteobacteria bacterium]
MNNNYLYNCWYVGAWHHEIKNEPFARTILDEPIVFYRDENKKVTALFDECPHRSAPLSTGKVIGNEIQCGYHGFKFNKYGKCTWVPGQKQIPSKACVRFYPVIEKWKWIWIWMGQAELADEKLIPNFWWNNNSNWAVMEGPYFNFKGNYKLIVDNLLDGSHVSFVHSSTLGTEDVANIPTKTKWDELNVRTERWILDKPPAPMYKKIGNFVNNVDRWQLIDFVPPSSVVLDTGSCNVGTKKELGFNLVPVNSMTPETENSTHVFWAHNRNFQLNSDNMNNLIKNQMTTAWLEDLIIMEQQQIRIEKNKKK